MSRTENAVSEITAFLLISAVILSGVCITAAVLLPEMEKNAEAENSAQITSSLLHLKTGIDRLWIQGTPGMHTGGLLPTGSLLSPHSSAVTLFAGTKISFTHKDEQHSANLLGISCSRDEKSSPLIYEGGAVFAGEELLLPYSTGDKDTVLICFTGNPQTLTANSPTVLHCTYQSAKTCTNITRLTISSGAQQTYWEEALQNTQNITLITCTASLEAVV